MWMSRDPNTGWRRLIGSPKLQIIFHKRATKYRSLLWKMTYKDKGSYESSPPKNVCVRLDFTTLSCHVRTLTSQVTCFADFSCSGLQCVAVCCSETWSHYLVVSRTHIDESRPWHLLMCMSHDPNNVCARLNLTTLSCHVRTLASQVTCVCWFQLQWAAVCCSVLQCVWDLISLPCRSTYAHW